MIERILTYDKEASGTWRWKLIKELRESEASYFSSIHVLLDVTSNEVRGV